MESKEFKLNVNMVVNLYTELIEIISQQEENFNRALETCKKTLKADIDGDYVGAWLLTW